MMTWTQPLCDDCWNRAHPGVPPVRLRQPDEERCCTCGARTKSGIYARINPKEVDHPKLD